MRDTHNLYHVLLLPLRSDKIYKNRRNALVIIEKTIYKYD